MLILLVAFFTLCFASEQPDPYSDFAQATNKLLLMDSTNSFVDMHRLADNTLILYSTTSINPTFLRLYPNGDVFNKVTLTVAYSSPEFSTPQICWEDSQFILPVKDGSNNGMLQCYDYSFELINTFGGNNNGTTSALELASFMTVTKVGSYYYVGGSKNNNCTVFRFTLNGILDTTFNSSNNTGGYITFNSMHDSIFNIVSISDAIIFVTKDNILAALPIHSGTLTTTPSSVKIPAFYTGYQGLFSNIEPYDDSSFFIAAGPVIYKYKYDNTTHTLALDTSFNQTGSLAFDKASTLLANPDNWYPIYSIKKVGNFLYAAGEYKSDNMNSTYYPWIVCYNISNMTSPYLEPSFFEQGYFTPNWFQNSSWGAQSILPITTNPHSFFISGGQFVEYVTPSTSSLTPYTGSSSAPIADTSHPYSNFASSTNNILYLPPLASLLHCFQLPTKDIIIPCLTDYSLKRIDTQGNLIQSATTTTTTTIAPFSVYYDTNKILVTGYNTDNAHSNIGIGAIQFLDYTLQTITSFGDSSGQSTIEDPTYTNNLIIAAVNRVSNYYYAGGDNGFNPIIARFNVSNGKLDTTFNGADSTPGYYLYTAFNGQTKTILPLAHVLILFTTNNQLLVFSYNDFSAPVATLQLDSQSTFTNLLPYDGSSFFIAAGTTIYKYTYSNTNNISSLTLDTTFNQTGSLSFNINTTTILNSVPFSSHVAFSALIKNGNSLFVLGNYKSGHASFQSDPSEPFSTYPFILCYTISNMTNPTLDTTFFNAGYYAPSWYQNSPNGGQQIWLTNETIASMFLEGDSCIKNVPFNDTFLVKSIIPKTLPALLQFQGTQGRVTIPFLQ